MDLLQYLVQNKALKRKAAKHLKEKAQKENKPQEEVILETKSLEELELFKLKSKFVKVPLKEAVPDELSLEVLSLIPKESAEFYKMVPLAVKDNILEVGMLYPENPQTREALKFLARQQKLTLRIFLITRADFRKCLAKYQAPQREVEKAIRSLEEEMSVRPEEGGELIIGKEETARLVEEAPVIKTVAVILRQAVEGEASDIHIEPTRDLSRVRYRMDGILYSSLTLPKKAHPAIIARIKILTGLKIDETRIPQDGRFSTKVGGKRIDFRVSTFPTTLGEKVVLRVLDPEEGLKGLEELGLQGYTLEKVREAANKPYGMILATGPTGSGKTTTLYAILKRLSTEQVNVVTLEDPVEYFMAGISQSQVKPEINYTFARGLRQILRQDPDIIMVGEIRDEETANLAVHAALTGHLVLSTLHTNNAAGIIPRLIDMGIKPFLLIPSLSLGIAQRLVRRLCPHCKKKVKANAEEVKYVLSGLSDLPETEKKKITKPIYVYKAQGCKKCNKKGYGGRVAIFEALQMSDQLAAITIKSPDEVEINKEARRQGMLTLMEDGLLKALQGLTSLEEIMRVAEEK